MDTKELRDKYRQFHLRIEWSFNNYANAGLETYKFSKQQLIENIQCQIDYLTKIKEEILK